MTIVQGQTTAFKVNVLSGLENFAAGTSYTYKIALYTASATLNNSTTTYASTSNEVVGTGYTAGGKTLTIANPPTGDTTNNVAWISFNNVTWNPASFTCRGALIYNSTTGAAVAVLDFGADKTATSTFTVTFPTATSTTAVLTIS
jgi:hypothetical protein